MPTVQRLWKPVALVAALVVIVVNVHREYGPLKVRAAQPAPWADEPCKEDGGRFKLTAQSRVLVTGGAGFIGSSLMAALAARETKPEAVVGVDNFNPYYSPAYKFARAKRLKLEFALDVVRGDVCNATLLEDLFAKHRFTHVVHLAAQAGVRYSLTHPMSYVKNNVECYVALLEVMIKQPARPAFAYASSSSVYGLNTKIPFSETDAVTNPANLYGATKFMNEQISKSYNHIYQLRSVGLRFFTVYGPWGRPDMAAWLFTRAIEQGKPLTLYNRGEMRRDFTYIDDIVSGIIGAVQYCADKPAVFNLGNNQPVELMKFIETIELELGQKASLRHKISTAEIKETFADIDKAKALLGYDPKISMEVGLKNFIAWYKAEPRRNNFAGGLFNER
ncbi:hypothetical protein M885DRAFT_443388 [Pelagophyceae sp. CCMP2097]|nr:hypothetical protein M885DRAFT_443388 [Pelagophyceae sp. CCMP2097]